MTYRMLSLEEFNARKTKPAATPTAKPNAKKAAPFTPEFAAAVYAKRKASAGQPTK